MSVTVDQSEYEWAIADNVGWCTFCEDFTNSNVEPDARGYQCEICGDNTVYGAEEALLQMFIEVDFD